MMQSIFDEDVYGKQLARVLISRTESLWRELRIEASPRDCEAFRRWRDEVTHACIETLRAMNQTVNNAMEMAAGLVRVTPPPVMVTMPAVASYGKGQEDAVRKCVEIADADEWSGRFVAKRIRDHFPQYFGGPPST